MNHKIKILQATTPEQIEHTRTLFREYAESLGFSLCFQGFDKEMAELPGKYTPPDGRLYLAEHNGTFVGCIALRKLEEGVCEMKRLYVQPESRGLGIGKVLAEKIIEDAKETGYSVMRLDTLPVMEKAIFMYRAFGFKEIPPYYHNPVEGALFFELVL